MVAKKLFNEWYGYDKHVLRSERRYQPRDLYIRSGSNYYNYYLSEEIANYIKNSPIPEEQKKFILARHTPESDGRTDKDFIVWVESNDLQKLSSTYSYAPWRAIEIVSDQTDLVDTLLSELNIFFKADSTRSDQIFRIIEINEFLHKGTAGQTFEEFLNSNTEYEENCKKLLLKKYSPVSETLISYQAPTFLSFGPKVSQKARKLLLELEHNDFVKVIDYKNNPLMSARDSKATTHEFVKLFIDTALGKITLAEVKELDPKEISNHIILAYMAGASSLWRQADMQSNIMSSTSEIIKELQRISYHGENFKRHFSYLISTGALSNLTAIEVVAVVLGYDKSARWSAPLKGKSELETITELMIEGKLDPTFISKVIAHIIIHQTNVVQVNEDCDWETIAEMPVNWAIETLPTSHKKSPLVYPAIIKVLMKN